MNELGKLILIIYFIIFRPTHDSAKMYKRKTYVILTSSRKCGKTTNNIQCDQKKNHIFRYRNTEPIEI